MYERQQREQTAKEKAKEEKEAAKLAKEEEKRLKKEAKEEEKRLKKEAKDAPKEQEALLQEVLAETSHEDQPEPVAAVPSTQPDANTPEASGKKLDLTSLYSGRVDVLMEACTDIRKIQRFSEAVGEMSGVDLLLVGGTKNDGNMVMLSLQRKLPLLQLLNGLPMVKGLSTKGSNIVARLED